MKFNFRIAAVSAVVAFIGFALIADSGSVPRRIILPPEPPTEPLKPTKKAKQAKALREAAAMMEEDDRRELGALGASISNKISKLDFSTERFTVKVKSISFMEVGTNILSQITFDYQEK